MNSKAKQIFLLPKGSLIDLVAPASKCSMDEVRSGIQVLESWGYHCRLPKNIFQKHNLFSAPDTERFKMLKAALLASDSQAIWCVRGGYGSMRLWPMLDKVKPKRQKLFLGLSDITSLHLYLNQKWKWPSLHAPILSRIGKGDLAVSSMSELKKLLSGELAEQRFAIKPLNRSAKGFKGHGQVMGGNFVTLAASFGTPYSLLPQKNILFLEEIAERGYRIDRLFMQLSLSGVLKNTQAIVLGDFIGGDEPDGRNFVWSVIHEWAKEQEIPIYAGLKVGHGVIQRTLPLGVRAVIQDNKLIYTYE